MQTIDTASYRIEDSALLCITFPFTVTSRIKHSMYYNIGNNAPIMKIIHYQSGQTHIHTQPHARTRKYTHTHTHTLAS